MYIRGLIPRTFTELAQAVPIGFSDAENIRVSVSVRGSAISLRNLGDMSSRPVPLWGFRLLN